MPTARHAGSRYRVGSVGAVTDAIRATVRVRIADATVTAWTTSSSWTHPPFEHFRTEIQRGDDALIPINSVFIGYRLVIDERTILVHAPIVSLILSPIGDGTDLLIYEDTLKRYQIDPETGEVSPR